MYFYDLNTVSTTSRIVNNFEARLSLLITLMLMIYKGFVEHVEDPAMNVFITLIYMVTNCFKQQNEIYIMVGLHIVTRNLCLIN